MTLSHEDDETFLSGHPFSFSDGAIDGNSSVTDVQIGLGYSLSHSDMALALRSTLKVGLDAFGATLNGQGLPDSHFFTWIGQADFVKRLDDRNDRLLLRGLVQLTPDRLLSTQQLSLGGVETVRGYRENRIVRDNGAAVSAELRLPVPQLRASGRTLLEVAPFFDAGYGYDTDPTTVSPDKFQSSAGVGLLAHPTQWLDMEVYYGHPFQDFGDHSDLQDVGVHFRISAHLSF